MRESTLRADLARANEASTTDRARADAAASELAAWKARPWAATARRVGRKADVCERLAAELRQPPPLLAGSHS